MTKKTKHTSPWLTPKKRAPKKRGAKRRTAKNPMLAAAYGVTAGEGGFYGKALEMSRPYVAVVLMADSERTRSTYATADEAVEHARSKIGEISRTQGGKALQFAICKVVEIVEATTPTVDRRAPKRGDGTPPPVKIEDVVVPSLFEHLAWRGLHTMENNMRAERALRAFGANDSTVERKLREIGAKKYGPDNWSLDRTKKNIVDAVNGKSRKRKK